MGILEDAPAMQVSGISEGLERLASILYAVDTILVGQDRIVGDDATAIKNLIDMAEECVRGIEKTQYTLAHKPE